MLIIPECVLQAKRRYEEDRKEEEAARKARLGEWVWNEGAGYFYNAVHRWYYDTKTSERGRLQHRWHHGHCPALLCRTRCSPKSVRHPCARSPLPLRAEMYYGGDPVNWTDQPSLPHEARYEVMTAPPPQRGAAAARPAAGRSAAAAAGRPAATQQYAVAGGKVMAHHPLAQVRWPGCFVCCTCCLLYCLLCWLSALVRLATLMRAVKGCLALPRLQCTALWKFTVAPRLPARRWEATSCTACKALWAEPKALACCPAAAKRQLAAATSASATATAARSSARRTETSWRGGRRRGSECSSAPRPASASRDRLAL